MTQDYKDTLLRFLTGNLNQQSGSNIPQFEEARESSSTIGTYLYANAGNGYEVKGILQGYQTNYLMIYGNTNSNKGFIVIIDENYQPIQYIDEYNTGTAFGEFQVLNVDEDGNVYGIDITNQPRFIMLNNITLKTPSQQEFSVRLRQSYNLPSPLSTANEYFAVAKAVGQGKYLIGGTILQSGDPYQIATELTINVGSTNDWVDYQDTTSPFVGQSMWASWNEDVLNFKIGGYVEGSSLFYVEYQKIGNSIGKWSMELPTVSGYSDGYYYMDSIILNENTAYVGIFDGGEYQTFENIYLYKIDYTNNQAVQIEKIEGAITVQVPSYDKRIVFTIKNGIVFFLGKQRVVYGAINGVNLNIGIIIGDNVSYTTIQNEQATLDYGFYISNIYNLYNYNLLSFEVDPSEKDFLVQQVYNVNNYNGIAYENTNSLVPHSGILYDNTELILFARNLYNKSVYENTTLSVIQIPNTMVNDISITEQHILGETNKILNENNESFTKNIYETVYLNFYNTMLIQDRNNPTYVNNPTASSRLNMSVSTAGDYTSARATKYKVVYLDFSEDVFNTTPVITDTSTGKVATYNMRIILPYTKVPLELSIISEDEATIYQTIDISSLTPGKIYDITQECYID